MGDKLKFDMTKKGDVSHLLPFDRLAPAEIAVAEAAARAAYDLWDPNSYGASPFMMLAYAINTAAAQAVAAMRKK